MRRLVQSKSVMVTLIALYMCASLAAIPMPRPVASFMANIGLSVADSASDGACSCGEASACSTSGSCCCAAKAATKDDSDELAGVDMGFELMSISCTPELKWLLAAVPPVFESGDGRLLNLAELKGERLVAFGVDVVSIHNLDVLSPPPRSIG
jgi:hypothetical protein